LFGIARKRVALYYRRRALRENSIPRDNQCDEASELGKLSSLPPDLLEQAERITAVRAAMQVLPDDHRKALIWKYAEGLSTEIIAIRLERTAKAVESLLSRARQEMRTLLREYLSPCNTQSDNRELSHE
jgi:RNA polymerase sigma-70 factor (ECF subfamily)